MLRDHSARFTNAGALPWNKFHARCGMYGTGSHAMQYVKWMDNVSTHVWNTDARVHGAWTHVTQCNYVTYRDPRMRAQHLHIPVSMTFVHSRHTAVTTDMTCVSSEKGASSKNIVPVHCAHITWCTYLTQTPKSLEPP